LAEITIGASMDMSLISQQIIISFGDDNESASYNAIASRKVDEFME
jgi:hypothetical protein